MDQWGGFSLTLPPSTSIRYILGLLRPNREISMGYCDSKSENLRAPGKHHVDHGVSLMPVRKSEIQTMRSASSKAPRSHHTVIVDLSKEKSTTH
jgi:hypothetical protein